MEMGETSNLCWLLLTFSMCSSKSAPIPWFDRDWPYMWQYFNMLSFLDSPPVWLWEAAEMPLLALSPCPLKLCVGDARLWLLTHCLLASSPCLSDMGQLWGLSSGDNLVSLRVSPVWDPSQTESLGVSLCLSHPLSSHEILLINTLWNLLNQVLATLKFSH